VWIRFWVPAFTDRRLVEAVFPSLFFASFDKRAACFLALASAASAQVGEFQWVNSSMKKPMPITTTRARITKGDLAPYARWP
jgi:hypothetical protein